DAAGGGWTRASRGPPRWGRRSRSGPCVLAADADERGRRRHRGEVFGGQPVLSVGQRGGGGDPGRYRLVKGGHEVGGLGIWDGGGRRGGLGGGPGGGGPPRGPEALPR